MLPPSSRPGSQSASPLAKPPSAPMEDDPDVYATVLSAMLAEQNPLRAITGDLTRMLDEWLHMGRKRQQDEQHLAKLQAQLHRMESGFSTVNPKVTGQRLDKIR